MFDISIDWASYIGDTTTPFTDEKMKREEYYSENSKEVLAVKKAFKLTEKPEEVLNEYIINIKKYLADIDIEKKREKDDEIERKANELNHTMNMKKLDID